ncbi:MULTISPECIES: methyltransferase domain-containing protein [unclassified Shewanella]|uniref:methyltransferase domain-containing protein n=2 Tax=unclassified Shewanella TaxID=196818 RepID=UPI00137C10F6|nr:methyltransferase domain-containing protein [Shewanella sp. Arc9-LZ]MBO1897469.1 methyltransferase domain-containing protein [Shewanella sp. BF02_Schw]QHS14908.1 methyltransferase domain-containing protein [Shewanella sp. Arc9-LZ]
MQDKNFDKLSQKFAQNIYGTTKGEIRAAVLWRDLVPALASLGKPRLRILDAGGGFGYLSQKLAALGHDVVLCDISEQMLALAQQQIEAANTALSIQLIHSPIQALTVEEYGQFDVILCHAVAEWLIDARSTLQGLLALLKPNGLFSLMFFNKEALRFHSLISGNFDYVNRDFNVKKKVGLTPTHPLYIEDVRTWFSQWQLSMVSQSGVRVINDYLKHNLPPGFDKHQLIEMELAYSQQEPYLSLGRYIHFVGQSTSQ